MRADARIIKPLRASTSLLTMIEDLKKLPPLPSVAHDVMNRLNDEFVTGNDVADVVGRDPGLTARLIGLANSAYFGLSRPVGDMREVVNRVLGVDTVRSLAVALAMRQSFDASRCPAFDTKRFWVHSLLTAESCKKMVLADDESSADERELAYVAGLCHNLGLLVLGCVEPDRTHTVLRAHGSDAEREESLSAALAREFGMDHREASQRLAELWDMPEPVQDAYVARCGMGSNNRLANMIDVAAESAGSIAPREVVSVDLAPAAARLAMAESDLRAAMPTDRQRERAEAIVQGV